jgi:membrane protease YdiL (CAAX protease family)
MLGAAGTLVASGVLLVQGSNVALSGPYPSAKVPIGIDLLLAGQNMWFYSIFDAYRDARVLRDDAGYKFRITRESLGTLASAPFRPSVLSRPWVWAGVPLALAAGLGVSYLVNRSDFTGNPSISDIHGLNVLGHQFSRGGAIAAGEGYFGTLFSPVGVGEESLFRGFIQTELEEKLGTWGGLVAASTIFGAVHFLNFGNDPKQGLVAVPVIGILGGSLGLAYIETGHKLETSVAMHFWYDFLLSSVAFLADPTHQPFVVQYGTMM